MSRGNQLSAASYKRLSWLFIVLAIVFFLVGLWKFIGYIRFTGSGEKVNAVVVEVDDSITSEWDGVHESSNRIIYAIYVTYTYQGQTYEHVLLDGYDVVYEGNELEVYVNKDNPLDARLPGNNLYQSVVMMLMLPVFGTVAKWLKNHSEQ